MLGGNFWLGVRFFTNKLNKVFEPKLVKFFVGPGMNPGVLFGRSEFPSISFLSSIKLEKNIFADKSNNKKLRNLI